MAENHSFGNEPITCHAFSQDRRGLVLSQKTPDVKMYAKRGNKWELTTTLSEHDKMVTSMDWAPKSNCIVTCGADRNAYVWSLQENGKWKPTLVVLRINRAATFVRWSPLENKFAVGCGARRLCVCYYEKDSNWWGSKHIKKPIRSTVTCVDWHPNNVLIAAGSSDFRARVFSAYMKDLEAKPDACSWGTKVVWAAMLAEFYNGGGGWVHAVSFSPCGNRLAWVGHDSSISVVDASQGLKMAVIKESCLPFMSLSWVTGNSLVAAGYDCVPMLFTYSTQGQLTFSSRLDIPPKIDEDSFQKKSARDIFHDRDKKGSEDCFTELRTQHKNTITNMAIHTGSKADCSKFSTSGLDGNIVIWDLKVLQSSLPGVRLS